MFEIDKQKFGAFVAKLRKEKGMTQKELAERLFISDKAVSKWETASSLPDTALLMPLADTLGVTVTELLMCQRIEQNNLVDTTQMEQVVKTAISYSDQEPTRTYQRKNLWGLLYLISLIISCLETLFASMNGRISSCFSVAVLLGAIFGMYFCFFAKIKLPAYYDEYRIFEYSDGWFHMNVPGLSFTNSNWPKILHISRIWSLVLMTVYPIISYAIPSLLPEIGQRAEPFFALAFILGGLFLPVYVVGKKYES